MTVTEPRLARVEGKSTIPEPIIFPATIAMAAMSPIFWLSGLVIAMPP